MSSIVSHYGIHWDNRGVAYLMQGRGGTNAIGLKQKAPFEVRLPSRKRHCNHQIPLSTPVPNDYHWDYFLQLLGDPLVDAMLPIPKGDGGVYYVDDPNGDLTSYLVLLSKLSSPIYPVVVPMWMTSIEAIIENLQETNVQPLVITQVEPKHGHELARIAGAAAMLPRKIVFSGSADVVVPPSMLRVKTALGDPESPFTETDLLSLPWENLGAAVVRKWMRKEWPPVVTNLERSYHGRARPRASTSKRPAKA